MERQFNNGDFEKLLRDNANQYRMYPSEKVWKGIHSALHTRRRWYGLTALVMFLLTGSLVSIVVFYKAPSQNKQIEQNDNSSQTNNQAQGIAGTSKKTQTFTPAIAAIKPAGRPTTNFTELFATVPVFDNNTPANVGKQPGSNLNTTVVAGTNEQNVPDLMAGTNETTDQFSFETYFSLLKQNNLVNTEEKALSDVFADQKNITNQSSVDENTEKNINIAISALNSQNVQLPKPNKQSRLTGQFYFAPTVSYRKLTENLPVVDLKNVVNHKPAMGLEFGFEGKYATSRKLSLKTGLQFNINRYDILAYSHPTEIATVALSSGYGIVDSLASYSYYRNFRGSSSSSNWLENFYFQVAIPVGAEFIISDKKNIQWGISGTIQPTYIIGDKAYAISSDFKNYAEFPGLMRRWNISTGVGTFVSYSTGRIKWQVGPHLRYQHLSSFVSTYSVKEKLYAVGLRVGATFNK